MNIKNKKSVYSREDGIWKIWSRPILLCSCYHYYQAGVELLVYPELGHITITRQTCPVSRFITSTLEPNKRHAVNCVRPNYLASWPIIG